MMKIIRSYFKEWLKQLKKKGYLIFGIIVKMLELEKVGMNGGKDKRYLKVKYFF